MQKIPLPNKKKIKKLLSTSLQEVVPTAKVGDYNGGVKVTVPFKTSIGDKKKVDRILDEAMLNARKGKLLAA